MVIIEIKIVNSSNLKTIIKMSSDKNPQIQLQKFLIQPKKPKQYTRCFYWKSYIKFQLALNLYYFWHHKYIFLAISNYFIQRIHGVCCNIVYHMSDKNSIPLVDNGFKFVPYVQMASHKQLVSMLGGGILFGLLKIVIKMDANNYSFAIILSKYAVISSLAIFCRVTSFLSTILPSPHQHCHDHRFDPPTGWGIITTLNLAKGCGDLIFSSHFMHFLQALYVIVWYCLPSYDQENVIKLTNKIKQLENKVQEKRSSDVQNQKLKKKIGKSYKKLHTNYRSDMLQHAQKMRRCCNWRWALIALMPFYTLLFIVIVISSRGHYTVDLVVALYSLPFLDYFVMHHWKEQIGKALQIKVSSLYPNLCKNYVQILDSEDLMIYGADSNYKQTEKQQQQSQHLNGSIDCQAKMNGKLKED